MRWKWTVYYMTMEDTRIQKIKSKRSWKTMEGARFNLRLSINERNVPGMPEDAIITGLGVTNEG